MELYQLIDELDEILYVIDLHTYELLYLNRAGQKTIGTTDYLGKKCYALLQGFDRPCSFCTRDLLCHDKFYTWEHANNHLGRHFILRDKLISFHGKPSRLEIAIDITEKEKTGRLVQEKLEIEQTLVECLRILTTEPSSGLAISTVLGCIGAFHHADRAYIYELEEGSTLVRRTHGWCSTDTIAQANRLQSLSTEDIRGWLDIFEKGGNIFIDHVKDIKETYPTEYDLLCRQHVESVIIVPLKTTGGIIGFLGVDNPRCVHDASLLRSLAFFVCSDIQKQRMEQQIAYMSERDQLTGLYNRAYFLRYVNSFDMENLSSLGVVFLDINGLKTCNDNFGYDFGDKLIVQIANDLLQVFDQHHTFRSDGDEFTILCPEIDHELFRERVALLGHIFSRYENCTVSMASTWSDSDLDIPALVRHADDLLYIEKQTYYKENPKARRHADTATPDRLHRAIENREFIVYLQAKVDLKTGGLIGAEALVRHLDAQAGITGPNQFIPFLEQERLVQFVDFYIFEEVCRLLEHWLLSGMNAVPISVNFSRITLMESNFIHRLMEIQSRFQVPRHLLEIEATERVGKLETENLAAMAHDLKQLGFGVSLDDFGAEYSSLALLSAMEMDVLKLDKSLINQIESDRKKVILVRSVIEVCREYGLKSIAEGIETPSQANILRGLGCDYGQGYLFSKPVSVELFDQQYHSALYPV